MTRAKQLTAKQASRIETARRKVRDSDFANEAWEQARADLDARLNHDDFQMGNSLPAYETADGIHDSDIDLIFPDADTSKDPEGAWVRIQVWTAFERADDKAAREMMSLGRAGRPPKEKREARAKQLTGELYGALNALDKKGRDRG